MPATVLNQPAHRYIDFPGSAYCLMAQVLERRQQASARNYWKKCLELGALTNPDEDSWMHLAQKKLQGKRSNQPPKKL
ncbi:hypothetical protein [Trichocoleus sp. FACHB-591]|uniref:hypothetical protein n=1 Tax=Trichocoleus sp. FACHB-591 TaxID=2692872 RepID=UPI001688DDE1|nr:hypothetical protein [Trichocoleus sp. FACHB-591]